MSPERRMFKWLPVYNYLVMLAALAYQAPWERAFGHHLHPDSKVRRTQKSHPAERHCLTPPPLEWAVPGSTHLPTAAPDGKLKPGCSVHVIG